MPKNNQTGLSLKAPGLKADVLDGAGTNTVFSLLAAADGAADTFTVDVTNVAGSTFSLTVTWDKASAAAKQLQDLATDFQFVVAISEPPGGYGTPALDTGQTTKVITLANGNDGIGPPVSASASAPSA